VEAHVLPVAAAEQADPVAAVAAGADKKIIHQ
jgi:hypothetical protein